MTKKEFLYYLSYPENLNADSVFSLKKLVLEYPYFQTGRVLYLKNLHNENNIDYEKNLHITAAYASNGKVLYNWIKKKPSRKDVVQEPVLLYNEQESIHSEVVEILGAIDNGLPEINKDTGKKILPKLEPLAILQEMEITFKEEPSNEQRQNATDEMQVLEKQMLREAYRTAMTVDLREGAESRQKTRQRATSMHRYLPANFEFCSFTDWLKALSQQTPAVIKTIQNGSGELIIRKKNKNEILNAFLLEETARPSPKSKAVFYSADSMAKKSLLDDENFISETLAKIYLQQGNLPKAKRAYEILLVKHPEKVHIFAPLLEKIKKLSEDQKSK
jgi:hypothetical protein